MVLINTRRRKDDRLSIGAVRAGPVCQKQNGRPWRPSRSWKTRYQLSAITRTLTGTLTSACNETSTS